MKNISEQLFVSSELLKNMSEQISWHNGGKYRFPHNLIFPYSFLVFDGLINKNLLLNGWKRDRDRELFFSLREDFFE